MAGRVPFVMMRSHPLVTTHEHTLYWTGSPRTLSTAAMPSTRQTLPGEIDIGRDANRRELVEVIRPW